MKHRSECFYCLERAVDLCVKCGASICEDHSTEDRECRDRDEDMALHVPDELIEEFNKAMVWS